MYLTFKGVLQGHASQSPLALQQHDEYYGEAFAQILTFQVRASDLQVWSFWASLNNILYFQFHIPVHTYVGIAPS